MNATFQVVNLLHPDDSANSIPVFCKYRQNVGKHETRNSTSKTVTIGVVTDVCDYVKLFEEYCENEKSSTMNLIMKFSDKNTICDNFRQFFTDENLE